MFVEKLRSTPVLNVSKKGFEFFRSRFGPMTVLKISKEALIYLRKFGTMTVLCIYKI